MVKDFRSLLMALKGEAMLFSAVSAALETKSPLPLQNMEALAPLASMEFDAECAALLETEEEVECCKRSIDEQFKAINELSAHMNGAASDIKKMIAKKQKDDGEKVEKEEKHRQKQLQDEQKKKEKQQKAVAKKKSAKKAETETDLRAMPKEAGMPAVPHWMINKPVDVANMEVVDSADLNAAKLMGQAFVFKTLPTKLVSITQEPAVKACVEIYRIQAMAQPLLAAEGRGQHPFQSDRKKRMSEVLQQLVPFSLLQPVCGSGLPKQWCDALTNIHLYACSPSMVAIGIERNGIGNIRLQYTGVKEVYVFTYQAIMQVANANSMEIGDVESVIDFCTRVLRDAKVLQKHTKTPPSVAHQWSLQVPPCFVEELRPSLAQCLVQAIDSPEPAENQDESLVDEAAADAPDAEGQPGVKKAKKKNKKRDKKQRMAAEGKSDGKAADEGKPDGNEEAAAEGKQDGGLLDGAWFHCMRAGEAMVIPGGCFTVERTVPVKEASSMNKDEHKSSYVIGWRVHYIDPEESPGTSCLAKMQKLHASRCKPSDTTNLFWTQVLDAVSKLARKRSV